MASPNDLPTYQLPNGTIPVLLSADTPELLRNEAAALRSYAAEHPAVAPQAIAEMLFRTRIARRLRALAMVTSRDELSIALQAVIDGREHPTLVRSTAPAVNRQVAYVCPGQGGQRPGMGRLFYEIPAFQDEVDRCATAFRRQFGHSPLDYLLDEQLPADDSATAVQPALFTQMAGLAALWRSFGVVPNITLGHSQGEIAAAYISGAITLTDAVSIVGIRAHAVDEFASDSFAMAVVAADRDTCEDLLARSRDWAQVSVLNSPHMVGISGERQTVQGIVETLTERGVFARVIAVRYPAHTTMINKLGDQIRTATQQQLQHRKFLDTDIDCLGATLGGPITQDLPVDEYWFWNLRNTVRFDKAVEAAVGRGVDTYVELSEHPTLQLAIQQNVSTAMTPTAEHPTLVVGTSERTATDLDTFTHNLAQLAVNDLGYPWECLRSASDEPVPPPLLDFPNTQMQEIKLWMPYQDLTASTPRQTAASTPHAETTPAQRLVEEWVRLPQRTLVPPRAIGMVDRTGSCADLATAVCAAATEMGAAARPVSVDNNRLPEDLDTLVILLAPSLQLDYPAAAAEVTAFLSDRTWWPGVPSGVRDCWLVTVTGEAATEDDGPPDPVHAAASASFRSIGADHLGVGFRHLDLPAGLATPDAAHAVVAALHTGREPELAFRDGGLYAKRIVVDASRGAESDANTPPKSPEHVLIVGGTGNLGLEFCDHFARHGARLVTLINRSGETAEVADRLRRIRSVTSAQLRVTECDVRDEAAVAELGAAHRDTPADLIIHAAVDHSAIEMMNPTAKKVDQALQTKVLGIWRILRAYPRKEDCRVVLCSSARATIGGRGQAVYAAANRMLDAMAHRLRTQGMDCVSVQWGQWPGLDDTSAARLAGIGVLPMSPADAIALGMAPIHGNAIVTAFDFDRAHPMLNAFGYGPLVSQLTSPVMNSPAPTVTAEQPSRPRRLIDLVAEAIGADRSESIDTTVPMVAIGLDSLQALELHRRVKAELNYEIEVADLLGGASIADVVAKLGH